MRALTSVENTWQDVRYALRQFWRSPGFAAAAIVSLALGIGANTAIFSLLDQILLYQPPVHDPGTLAVLNWEGPDNTINQGADAISYPMYAAIRDRNDVFSGVAASSGAHFGVGYRGAVERARGEFVSGNYFDMVAVRAVVGRTISPEDDRVRGASPVVVLSYAYWTSRFHQNPAILGARIVVNAEPFTVIGVARPGFSGLQLGQQTKIWIPIAMRHQVTGAQWAAMFGLDSDGRWVTAVGRLKPDLTRERAQASIQPLFHGEVRAEMKRAAVGHPIAFTEQDELRAWMSLRPVSAMASAPRDSYGAPLRILMAITSLVFLLACANVANLMLARAMEREREVAARIALGASTRRLARQALIESLILAIAASVAGLTMAWWTDRVLVSLVWIDVETSSFLNTAPYGRVFWFALAISILAGVLFSVGPMLRAARIDLSAALKQQAGTASGSQARFRQSLAFMQVFLSALLLMGAGLFLRSLSNLRSADPGFRADHLLVFSILPELTGYDAPRSKAYFHETLDRLRAAPGVESAGYNVVRVLDDWWGSPLTVEGYQSKEAAWAVNNAVSPGYFAAMGTPLLAGRDIARTDEFDKPKVAVVNESFARRFFAGRPPVGAHLGYGADPGTKMDIEVVGIARDSRYGELREESRPEVFVAADQLSEVLHANFYVRTRGGPEALIPEIRHAIAAIDPGVPLFAVETMEEEINQNLSASRLVATLASAFGALATVLAAVGLYGMLALKVARRRRELGIRMALGATRENIVWLVMKEAAWIVVVGVALAAPAAWVLGRLAESELYGVRAGDPATTAYASLAVIAIAFAACWVPTQRAGSVDPMTALRHD